MDIILSRPFIDYGYDKQQRINNKWSMIHKKYELLDSYVEELNQDMIGKEVIKFGVSWTWLSTIDTSYTYGLNGKYIYKVLSKIDNGARFIIQCTNKDYTIKVQRYQLQNWIVLDKLPKNIGDYIRLDSLLSNKKDLRYHKVAVDHKILKSEFKKLNHLHIMEKRVMVLASIKNDT